MIPAARPRCRTSEQPISCATSSNRFCAACTTSTPIPDQSQWYPNPATPTPNATLNGSGITFGIHNLDPYVWFVHRVLNNSSYGFSFDDDVANAQAASSSLEIAVGECLYGSHTRSTL